MSKNLNIIICILNSIISLMTSDSLLAQKYTIAPLDTIHKETRWIEVDKMQHLYLIEEEHGLSKYSSSGELLYQFNENNLGEISALDVQNPFYILVYYNDYATLVLLDRTLSEIRRQDLTDLGIDQIKAIAMASDNNIWLFDNTTYTVKKINAQNQVLLESIDLSLEINETINPTRLVEYNNKIYLNSPEIGIFVFDSYANYFKTIYIKELDYFQLYENQLFFIKDNKFQTYNLLSFQTEIVDLNIMKPFVNQASVAQERLYLNFENRVEIIKLKVKRK